MHENELERRVCSGLRKTMEGVVVVNKLMVAPCHTNNFDCSGGYIAWNILASEIIDPEEFNCRKKYFRGYSCIMHGRSHDHISFWV